MSDMENIENREVSVKEQIKFAVVMYGGGSLAIYINGVAQELLRMVQATAAKQHPRIVEHKDDKPVAKTIDVYRKIAFLLSDKKILKDFTRIGNVIAKRKENIAKAENEAQSEKLRNKLERSIKRRAAFNKKLQTKVLSNEQPNVNFVIDVLTGSSAGGINAVYLSKALVRGVDGMDDLQRLWIEQGDFAKLLNDKKSVADNGLDLGVQPASLLNSQRMYLELLKSLEAMDTRANAENRMVEELDLYVTYTDFRGIPLPMFLSDKAVLERRHKHVFNFRFSENGINDFKNGNNPFLAFAARTTSSFPLAFEPSRLIDIDEILTNAMPSHEDGNSDNPNWTKYFRELADEHGKPIDWKTRSFVDGGALDNKPFGYAIDKLTQRAGEGIVRRKLLYIEPAPEDLSNERNDTAKPNAIANLLAQGVNMPRYETIREDLQRLLERNRLIRRMNRITSDVERDFEGNFDKLSGETFPGTIEWASAGLNEVAKHKGLSALPYYRLRISALTDDIAKMATAYFRVDEDSDYFMVLRSLIAVWRDDSFAENRVTENGATQTVRTLNKFLYLYDVEYRFRRLRFMMRKLENLLRRPDAKYEQLLKYTDKKIAEVEEKIKTEEKKPKTIPQNAADDKKIVEEHDTPIDVAMNRQEGLVLAPSAMLNAVIIEIPVEEKTAKKKIFSELEKLTKESIELREKRSLIEKMDFNSDEFINAAIKIQKQVNEIYQRLRREHEYLHTGLKNPQLASDLLQEIDNKAKLTDKAANDAEVAENNLQNFMLTLGDVELELQTLEISQQKTDGATRQATDFKQNILDKHKRIQKQQREKKDDGKPPEKLSDEELRILKGLSFSALERILGFLKKDTDGETDKTDGKTYTVSAEKGKTALENAYGADGFKRIFKALNNTAFFLEGVYNAPDYFIRRAGDDMKKLLNIGNETRVSTAVKTSNFIRDYLKVYYPLFDSYDQISFPVYFETSVGEAVEVDIVRISSRDAHSLINEESADEKRRKLAGDALYAFGAFLDPRWRMNDIMWGRLDGAERLISTLLPDAEHENVREFLIEEANTTILREILLSVASEDFQGIVVDSLTFAGTEAIAQKAVDKLVQGLTKTKIKEGISKALVNTLKEDIIYEQVRSNYEVSRSPEPEPTLKILSRATQITGKILEGIADQSGLDGGRISWIAKLGQIFWGLVTVAVPNTMWNLLVNYWLQLLYMFEVVVVIGATLLLNQTVQQFGITALIITIAFHLAVIALQDLMRGNKFLDLLKYFIIVLILGGAALGFFSFYALTFGDKDLWVELVKFRNKLSGYGDWQKVFSLIIPGILLIAVIGWRELKNRNIRSFGSAILALTLILLTSGTIMTLTVKPTAQSANPIIDLEFADTVEEIKKITGGSEQQTALMTADLKTALLIDSFVFIPVYLCLFLLLAQLLAFRRRRRFGKRTILFFTKTAGEKTRWDFLDNFKLTNAVWLAIIAALLFIGAGIADGIENFYSYKILNIPIEQLGAHQTWLTTKTIAAAVKFIMLFAGIGFISLDFLRKPNKNKTNFGLFALFAVLLAVSVAGMIFTIPFHEAVSFLLIVLIVIALIIASVLIGLNKNFLKDF